MHFASIRTSKGQERFAEYCVGRAGQSAGGVVGGAKTHTQSHIGL